MANHNNSDFDQHDPKVFKETLGSFGTTTNPGARNQLVELQTKVRQGVKHVEIHLANQDKGQFNVSDVPDKYGFEQRRTIMQLAKLNQQTLSVHGTFSINSFSGLGQGGFNEQYRAKNIKEIDETLKFAAETAKGGAVVFHLHETAMPTPPGELNLPQWYLDKLKKEKPEEYDILMKRHLKDDELNRQFVDNPDLEAELKVKFENFSDKEKQRLKDNFNVSNWKEYYNYDKNEQIKLEQDGTPLVVVGNSISRASRQQDIIDLDGLKKLDEREKAFMESIGVNTNYEDLTVDDFQRIQAKLTNGKPSGISDSDFKELKKKLVIEYKDVLTEKNRMKSLADKEFFQKTMDMQIKVAELQKKDFEYNKKRYSQYLHEIEDIKKKERELMKDLNRATDMGDKQKEKEILVKLNGGMPEELRAEYDAILRRAQAAGGQLASQEDATRYQEIMSQQDPGLKGRRYDLEMREIGQLEYQKLEKYDEYMSQFNEQIKKAKEQKENAKVLTDEIFEKNASAMGHLGLKSLRYQLDMKDKSKESTGKLKEYDSKIQEIQKKLETETSEDERYKLNADLQKLKYDKRLWVGTKDYEDIDVIKRPLYLAPENIMAGYGYMDSLEEYKAVIRTSWDEFAKKLMSKESMYSKIREDYEKETGIKIDSYEKAIQVAKNHIGGTFDNAHAGVWLKYFKREGDESEEHRIERFNKWLNTEAENMAKEGIIKHIHFNDTQAKDDDHNLLGSGILDIHDLRERLRRAGVKEPLIVEAGGRGGDGIMHILNAFDIFNPEIHNAQEREDRGYSPGATGVSDWVSVKRDYENRPIYSPYGMSYNTFRHQPPGQGQPKGDWSGTGFL